MRGFHDAHVALETAAMRCHQRVILIERKVGWVYPQGQGRPDQMHGYGIPVRRQMHHTFAGHVDDLKESIVVRLWRECSEVFLFLHQQGQWGLLRGLGGTLLVGLLSPDGACGLQVGVVIERAPNQEMLLHKLHQVLDAPLLVAGPQTACIRVEPKLDRKLPEGRVPDGVVPLVAAQCNGLHIIGRDDPGHTAEFDKAGDQAPDQGFLAHVAGKSDKHPPAVFQSGGKEVAGLTLQRRLG